jgi:hypothetical protein
VTPPPAIPARVNAYRAEHPESTFAGAARALGLKVRTVERAFYAVRKRAQTVTVRPLREPSEPREPKPKREPLPPREPRPRRERKPPIPRVSDEQRRAMSAEPLEKGTEGTTARTTPNTSAGRRTPPMGTRIAHEDAKCGRRETTNTTERWR